MRLFRWTVVFTMIAAVLVLAGCQQQGNQADVKDRVERSFEQAQLENVNVDTDQENRVVRLKGEVQTEAEKQRAEQLAREAATGWQIANEIGVRPEGQAGERAEDVASAEDQAIQAKLEEEFTKARLNEAGIDYDVNNGVVTLSGNVRNASQKQEAETLAKKVENVEQVVNNIEVGQARGAAAGADDGSRADTDEGARADRDEEKKE